MGAKAYAVLIVEDEALLALDLHQTVEAAGYTVIGCPGTVSAAKAIIGRSSPDAVVLDIVLESQPNFELADFLADRDIPFLFVTVCDRSSIPERHSARPFLAKPCTAEQLVPELKGILRQGNDPAACVGRAAKASTARSPADNPWVS
jgi:DNA-binding response OmpR family regulator